MCNEDKTIKLSVDDTGKISVIMDAYAVWNILPDVEKELVMRDTAHWDIIRSALRYELGEALATPSFNHTLFKLRQMIATDNRFVTDIVATFVGQVLQEWAKGEKKKREAEASYWGLYHKVKDLYPHLDIRPTLAPTENTRFSVRAEIEQTFGNILSVQQVSELDLITGADSSGSHTK